MPQLRVLFRRSLLVVSTALGCLLFAGVGQAAELGGALRSSADDAPIAGARVTVFRDGATAGVAVSGADGSWSVPLPAGDYVFVVEADGFVTEASIDRPCAIERCLERDDLFVVSLAEDEVQTFFDTLDPEAFLTGSVSAVDPGGIVAGTVEVVTAAGDLFDDGPILPDGSWTVGGLPAGLFFVRTRTLGTLVDEVFDDIPCVGDCDPTSGAPIALATGSTVAGIDFALISAGVVTGTLRAAEGGIVPFGRVAAYGLEGQLVAEAEAQNGVYRLEGLGNGAYFIVARDVANRVGSVFPNVPCQNRGEFLGCTFDAATPVAVAAGEASVADLVLTVGASIRGRVLTTGAQPLTTPRAVLLAPDGRMIDTSPLDIDGSYRFDGIGSPVVIGSSGDAIYAAEAFNDVPCPQLACDLSAARIFELEPGSTAVSIDFFLERLGRLEIELRSPIDGSQLDGRAVVYTRDGSARYASMPTSPPSDPPIQSSAPPRVELFVFVEPAEGPPNFAAQVWDQDDGATVSFPDATLGGVPPAAVPIVLSANEVRRLIFVPEVLPSFRGTVTVAGAPPADLPDPLGEVIAYRLDGTIAARQPVGLGAYRLDLPADESVRLGLTSPESNLVDELWRDVACLQDVDDGLVGCDPASAATFAAGQGGDVDIDFELVAGGSISGSIVDANGGAAIAGARAALYSADGELLAIEDAEPDVAFRGLPPGTFFVLADGPDGVYFDRPAGAPSCLETQCPPQDGTPLIIVDTDAIEIAQPIELEVCGDACPTPQDVLVVQQQRFEVRAAWRDFDGNTGEATAVPLTDDSGYFWFFRDTNVELVVKVLDACVDPFDRFWVFTAGLTNVEVDLEVVDRVSGALRVYRNPLGVDFQPILDTDAFDTCDAAPQPPGIEPLTVTTSYDPLPARRAGRIGTDELVKMVGGDCGGDADSLCLGEGGRFRIDIDYRTFEGDNGPGRPVQLTADTGYFWFFNEDNVEVVIKVLDACVPPFDRFWVFAAGLTDVEVTMTVTDTATGERNDYDTTLGLPFPPILDTDAFATCDAMP
ncbi:MAG: carboxypeptidase-like regulatory domain-containing protein [Acidobacteriota bacterium]